MESNFLVTMMQLTKYARLTDCNTSRGGRATYTTTFSNPYTFYQRVIYLTPSPTPFWSRVASRPTETSAPSVGLSLASSVPASSKSGPSTGAIVGIAVGGAAPLALIALVVFCMMRRRKRRTTAFVSDTTATSNTYAEGKPELEAAVVAGRTGAGVMSKKHNDGIVKAELVGKGIGTKRPATFSPSPRSDLAELPTAGGLHNRATTPTWTSSPATQHTELPANGPGGQPHTHIAGGEIGATSPAAKYVENTGPYYSEAHVAPSQANASRLAELEASQRELEERMARMRHLSALEEEHARMQAEIARLRSI